MSKNEIITDPDIKERRIFIILIICLSGWIVSVAGVQIYEFPPNDFGPYQHLPFFYWPLLIIVCYFNIIPSKKYTKITAMFVLGLMTIGTLSIIEPYGRIHDSWQNVATSKLIFQEETLTFGHEYVRSYPQFFLLFGTFQELNGLSVGSVVRITPLFFMVAYLLGLVLVVNSISSLFKFDNDGVWNITSISFLFITVFGLSLLGLRINAAPQSIAYVSFFYLVFVYLKTGFRWRIVSLLLSITLILTHFITPPVMFLAFLCFLTGYSILNRNNMRYRNYIFPSFIFPFVAFLAWSIYIANYFLGYGVNFIEELFHLEQKFDLGTVGRGLPTNELILIYRQITIIIVGCLLVYSYLIILKKRRSLGISLGLFGLALLPGYVFYILQSEFASRILEFSTLPASLIFGFGIYEALKTKNYLKHIIIILILIASYASILTSNNGDLYEGITQSEIMGSKFALAHTDINELLYSFRLPSDNYSVLWRGLTPLSPTIHNDINQIILKAKVKLIVISDMWLKRQMYIEKKENNSVKILEANYTSNTQVKKIYDNQKFRIYYVKQH